MRWNWPWFLQDIVVMAQALLTGTSVIWIMNNNKENIQCQAITWSYNTPETCDTYFTPSTSCINQCSTGISAQAPSTQIYQMCQPYLNQETQVRVFISMMVVNQFCLGLSVIIRQLKQHRKIGPYLTKFALPLILFLSSGTLMAALVKVLVVFAITFNPVVFRCPSFADVFEGGTCSNKNLNLDNSSVPMLPDCLCQCTISFECSSACNSNIPTEVYILSFTFCLSALYLMANLIRCFYYQRDPAATAVAALLSLRSPSKNPEATSNATSASSSFSSYPLESFTHQQSSENLLVGSSASSQIEYSCSDDLTMTDYYRYHRTSIAFDLYCDASAFVKLFLSSLSIFFILESGTMSCGSYESDVLAVTSQQIKRYCSPDFTDGISYLYMAGASISSFLVLFLTIFVICRMRLLQSIKWTMFRLLSACLLLITAFLTLSVARLSTAAFGFNCQFNKNSDTVTSISTKGLNDAYAGVCKDLPITLSAIIGTGFPIGNLTSPGNCSQYCDHKIPHAFFPLVVVAILSIIYMMSVLFSYATTKVSKEEEELEKALSTDKRHIKRRRRSLNVTLQISVLGVVLIVAVVNIATKSPSL